MKFANRHAAPTQTKSHVPEYEGQSLPLGQSSCVRNHSLCVAPDASTRALARVAGIRRTSAAVARFDEELALGATDLTVDGDDGSIRADADCTREERTCGDAPFRLLPLSCAVVYTYVLVAVFPRRRTPGLLSWCSLVKLSSASLQLAYCS